MMATDSHMVCKRAVRILLECFLVWQLFCRRLHGNERNWTEIGSARKWGEGGEVEGGGRHGLIDFMFIEFPGQLASKMNF